MLSVCYFNSIRGTAVEGIQLEEDITVVEDNIQSAIEVDSLGQLGSLVVAEGIPKDMPVEDKLIMGRLIEGTPIEDKPIEGKLIEDKQASLARQLASLPEAEA